MSQHAMEESLLPAPPLLPALPMMRASLLGWLLPMTLLASMLSLDSMPVQPLLLCLRFSFRVQQPARVLRMVWVPAEAVTHHAF